MSNFIKTFIITCFIVLMSVAGFGQTAEQTIRNANWYTVQIAPGLSWKTCSFASLFNSKQDIYVGTVDLNQQNIKLSFSYTSGGGKTVSTYAAQIPGTMLAVNGNYYDTSNHIPVQYMRVTGYSYLPGYKYSGTGAVVSDSTGRSVNVLFKNNIGGNWAALSQPNIMATLYNLIENGQNTLSNDTYMAYNRHPRTVIGKTADNKLLIVVVDGRTTRAAGMTFAELQVLMKALNCTDAINMDGGGSSTFWVKGYGTNGVVNKPSDGSQRAVANAINIVLTPIVGVNETIYESATGGQNNAYYTETGVWGDNATACGAVGVTPGLGTRYGSTYTSVAGVKKARFTPLFSKSGQYKVYATWPAAVNRRAGILYRVNHTGGLSSVTINQSTQADNWVLLGTYTFAQGSAGYVEISNENLDLSGSMYAGAIKFEEITPSSVSNWLKY